MKSFKENWIVIIMQAIFGSVFQVGYKLMGVERRGPLLVVIFHPLCIVFAMTASFFLGETIHVGSDMGKAKEWEKREKNLGANNSKKKLSLYNTKQMILRLIYEGSHLAKW
ncbi:hypothetical protein P3L10_030572 [Capsicum annuum]